MKDVIGKEFFYVALNKLTLDISSEDHSMLFGDTSIKLTHGEKLVLGKQNSQAKVENVPAFYRILRERRERKIFEIKAHPMLSKIFELRQYKTMKFPITTVPMLVPTLPWNSTQR